MTDQELRHHLTARADRERIAISDSMADALVAYMQLLRTWNRKINLAGFDLDAPTGVRQGIDRLLIEPLAASRFVPSGFRRLIDIGSGGGSPAIPLAVAARLAVSMVESRARKAAFLAEAVRVLELQDATIETRRFEALLSRAEFLEAHDLVTIRAVKVEPGVLMDLQTFVRPGGQIFLFGTAEGALSDVCPPLIARANHALLDESTSRLGVIEKPTTG